MGKASLSSPVMPGALDEERAAGIHGAPAAGGVPARAPASTTGLPGAQQPPLRRARHVRVALRIVATTALASASVVPIPSGAADAGFFTHIERWIPFDALPEEAELVQQISALTSQRVAPGNAITGADSPTSVSMAGPAPSADAEPADGPLKRAISRYAAVRLRLPRFSEAGLEQGMSPDESRAVQDFASPPAMPSAPPPSSFAAGAAMVLKTTIPATYRTAEPRWLRAPIALSPLPGPGSPDALEAAAGRGVAATTGQGPAGLGEALAVGRRASLPRVDRPAIAPVDSVVEPVFDPDIGELAVGKSGSFSAPVAARLKELQAAPGAAQGAPEAVDFAQPLSDRLVARIAGIEAGAVEFRQSEGSMSVKLGSLLDLISSRIPADDFARMRSSSSADTFVPLAQLKDAGLPIAYDPVYDEITIGGPGASPNGEAKSHIDQIGPEQAGPSRTMIEQIQ